MAKRKETIESDPVIMVELPILSEEARLVEIILFIENDAVSLERLMKMTGYDKDLVIGAVEELTDHYRQAMHGMDLLYKNDAWQFVPVGELHARLRKCYGRKVDRRLSRAAMETLSIIAYSQPITRREVDNIRGVASDNIVRILREREYIKVVGRKSVPGHPCLYGTTKKFLFEFNLPSISALPKLSEIDRERFAIDEDQFNFEEEDLEDDEA